MVNEKNTEPVNFAELRKGKGLTLEELARRTGYGVSTINGLEKTGEGGARLRAAVLRALTETEKQSQTQTSSHRVYITSVFPEPEDDLSRLVETLVGSMSVKDLALTAFVVAESELPEEMKKKAGASILRLINEKG